MLASGLAQRYQFDGTPAESHPLFRPHPVQGWSPDFIPRLTGDAIEAGLIDAIQPVSGAESLRLARELARKEGIFCGITGGGVGPVFGTEDVRRAAADDVAASPKVALAISPMPASDPKMLIASIGSMTIFWFGESASCPNALMYLSAIK